MVETGSHSHLAEGCAVCGENHPFDMPAELVFAALSGDLVIFAGAGISTESRRTYGGTFADRIARELGLDEAPSFPEPMTASEQAHGALSCSSEYERALMRLTRVHPVSRRDA